jgi:hypothetical protein
LIIAGLDPAIHAEAWLAQCYPPALGCGASAWTTGIGERSDAVLRTAVPVVMKDEGAIHVEAVSL